jgi:hypothetical protein
MHTMNIAVNYNHSNVNRGQEVISQIPAIHKQHSLLLLPSTMKRIVVVISATCFQIHKLCILPAGGICVFQVIHRINSDYFLEQH